MRLDSFLKKTNERLKKVFDDVAEIKRLLKNRDTKAADEFGSLNKRITAMQEVIEYIYDEFVTDKKNEHIMNYNEFERRVQMSDASPKGRLDFRNMITYMARHKTIPFPHVRFGTKHIQYTMSSVRFVRKAIYKWLDEPDEQNGWWLNSLVKIAKEEKAFEKMLENISPDYHEKEDENMNNHKIINKYLKSK